MKNIAKKILKYLLPTVSFVCVFSFATFSDWINDGQGYKYMNNATSQYVVNNWLQTGNGFYFFDQNGYIVKGWYLINGKYYYFNKDGLMQIGFQELNGKTYYLDRDSGQMVVGWVQVYNDGVADYYYFNNDGTMAIGWKQVDGKWYYFNEGKCLINTWAKINDIWYHLGTTGAMDTGWIQLDGKMYHLNVSNGSLTKGWIQDQNGVEYYLSDNDGSLMVNTTVMIGGISCSFDEMGRCIGKNQQVGDIYGNTGTGNFYNSIQGKGQVATYGVNIGVAPGQNAIQGVVSSNEQQLANSTIQAGATTGPQ